MTARPAHHRALLLLTGLSVLAGCAQLPPALQRPAAAVGEQAAARAAQGDYHAAAELYQRAAANSTKPARSRLLLRGGEAAARDGNGELASRLLTGVNADVLNDSEQARLQLARLEARIAGQPPAEALSLLPPPGSDAPPQVAARVWSLRADLLFAQNHLAEGVHALVQRDVWLLDPAAVKVNDYRIWNTLKGSPQTATAHGGDAITQGWIDLAAIAAKVWPDRGALEDALGRWERSHPGHPAARHILPERFDYTPTLTAMTAGGGGSIGLALPLSGPFADAAAALRDGFFAAYYDSEAPRPSLRVYDTTLIPGTQRLLEQARADGVRMLVGPLDKQAVASLANIANPGMLMLALNYTDTGHGFPGFYQFGLAPEDEARAAARRALAEGLGNAIVLVPDGDWGSRILSAFRDTLQTGGGRLLDYATYNPKEQDYGDPIKRLLRYRRTGNSGPKETTDRNRRQDADFIFVAAQPNQARLIRTQLRFYHATRLPVFATSHVFSGEVDPQRDSDLNGLRFADMPWILGGDPTVDNRRQQAQRLWPDTASRYPRLYAMGFDAWLLAGRLRSSGVQPGHLFAGDTGDLYLQPDGEIRRRLSWAHFSNGRPQPLPKPEPATTTNPQPVNYP